MSSVVSEAGHMRAMHQNPIKPTVHCSRYTPEKCPDMPIWHVEESPPNYLFDGPANTIHSGHFADILRLGKLASFLYTVFRAYLSHSHQPLLLARSEIDTLTFLHWSKCFREFYDFAANSYVREQWSWCSTLLRSPHIENRQTKHWHTHTEYEWKHASTRLHLRFLIYLAVSFLRNNCILCVLVPV